MHEIDFNFLKLFYAGWYLSVETKNYTHLHKDCCTYLEKEETWQFLEKSLQFHSELPKAWELQQKQHLW